MSTLLPNIFDPDWIKANTNYEETVTFSFKKQNIPYGEEAEWQTIYFDGKKQKYSLTDDWGGEVFLTWDEFLGMLKDRHVERLVEMSFNSRDGGMIDKRKHQQHYVDMIISQEKLDVCKCTEYRLCQQHDSPSGYDGIW